MRGRLREILAEEILVPYLPPHFDLVRGLIVGARQSNVNIVHRHYYAPISNTEAKVLVLEDYA